MHYPPEIEGKMATVKAGRTSIQVVVSEEDYAALKAYSEQHDTTLSAVFRDALSAWGKAHDVPLKLHDVVWGRQSKAPGKSARKRDRKPSGS
jgi:hypothetical protein